MAKQLEIPFEEYKDKTIPIPFEEAERERIAKVLEKEKPLKKDDNSIQSK